MLDNLTPKQQELAQINGEAFDAGAEAALAACHLHVCLDLASGGTGIVAAAAIEHRTPVKSTFRRYRDNAIENGCRLKFSEECNALGLDWRVTGESQEAYATRVAEAWKRRDIAASAPQTDLGDLVVAELQGAGHIHGGGDLGDQVVALRKQRREQGAAEDFGDQVVAAIEAERAEVHS